MLHINEWQKPPPTKPQGPGQPTPPSAPAISLSQAIQQRLMALAEPPGAVHFYLGEGLRWIRVGFDGQAPLPPARVADVGSAIAACLGPADKLYFHALRPRDLLFFMPDDQPDPGQVGLPPEAFGSPLKEVLQAWHLAVPS